MRRTNAAVALVAGLAAMGTSSTYTNEYVIKAPELDPDRMTLGGLRYGHGPGYAGRGRGRPTPTKRRRMNTKHAARRARHARAAKR